MLCRGRAPRASVEQQQRRQQQQQQPRIRASSWASPRELLARAIGAASPPIKQNTASRHPSTFQIIPHPPSLGRPAHGLSFSRNGSLCVCRDTMYFNLSPFFKSPVI
ncbi:hypothetical protein VFPFJ_09239 [Purpureocillium lilacinum]|uniref:Uncharacterized protein n=1 Tax=Purpureocillium lilacinum TaxID=33203 RepID=A0A179GS75_PURLI|nr:hypothetical protein VFPFJ_09239 [Purpureocillium lilacinum]OAQ80785.1 hypothetical protein VFPFJ_09239 [Purpureocillium lilacinum]